MVKVYISDEDGDVHFKLFGVTSAQFDELLEIFKKHYCSFNRITKDYVYPLNVAVLSILKDLRDYNYTISQDDLDMIKYSVYPPTDEFKKIKYIADKNLLEKHPPLVGKQGFENFQLDAINKLVKQNRAIVDISCRHGKSYIACMTMGTLYNKGAIDRIFIVCRTEGVQNFYSEILFFLGDLFTEDDIAIVSTSNREIEKYFNKKIIITNYTTFRLSCAYYNKNASVNTRKPIIEFDKWGTKRMIVLDEVQSINSYSTLQSHMLHLHRDFFEYRYGLSGTVGFNFLNWYSLAKFMLPKRIPSSYSEWSEYVTYDKFHSKVSDVKAQEFKEQVLDKITVTYHDCIVQPKDVEKINYCIMSPKMREMYKEVCNKFVKDIFGESFGKPSGQVVLQKFGVLSNFTSDPSLKENEIKEDWKITENPKLEVLESLLNKYIDDEKQRVIVWSVHPQILNELGKIFKKYKPLVIHGDTKTSVKKSERNEELEQFKKDPSRKLLLTNKVLSTSINIVECSRQIYWDLPLSSDDLNQSRERIRGPKQKVETETTFLLFDNSVDLYIWNEIILKKSKTRDAILTKESMSMEDFKNLLNPSRQYYVDGTSVN